MIKFRKISLKYNKIKCYGRYKVYVKKIRVLLQAPISNDRKIRKGEEKCRWKIIK